MGHGPARWPSAWADAISACPTPPPLLEPRATNTGENIEFTRAVLVEVGIAVSSVLFVSGPHEERRSYAVMRKLWPMATERTISWPLGVPPPYSSSGLHVALLVKVTGTEVP